MDVTTYGGGRGNPLITAIVFLSLVAAVAMLLVANVLEPILGEIGAIVGMVAVAVLLIPAIAVAVWSCRAFTGPGPGL